MVVPGVAADLEVKVVPGRKIKEVKISVGRIILLTGVSTMSSVGSRAYLV